MKDICTICGTTEVDQETAYCINDHDSWLEPSDPFSLVMDTCKRMHVEPHKMYRVMNQTTSGLRPEDFIPCQV